MYGLYVGSSGHKMAKFEFKVTVHYSYGQNAPRCATVFGGVVSRDGLGLGRIGAPGYRAHCSVAMAPMFKGIRFGRHHFCSKV